MSASRPSLLRPSSRWGLAAAVLVTLALPTAPTASAAPTSGSATAAATKTSSAAPLRVASYNIRCANCFEGRSDERPWAERRGAVVSSIQAQNLDVLGVQEASQGRISDAETGGRNLSQFDDLTGRLGGAWRVTSTNRYNCANPMSPNNCSYKPQGASKGTKILYNSARVQLIAAGSARMPAPNGEERSVAWAELRQLSTGRSFMFSNLHATADDKYHSFKVQQAQVAVATIKANNPRNLPMISVGDWNSSRFEKPSNGPYEVHVKAGFVDPLGGRYRTTTSAPGATVEKRIRTWVDSSNRYTRQAPAHKGWVNGSYIDYIMTTKMRVSEWETVARLDKQGRFVGVIPSDHNMVRATVWLPKA